MEVSPNIDDLIELTDPNLPAYLGSGGWYPTSPYISTLPLSEWPEVAIGKVVRPDIQHMPTGQHSWIISIDDLIAALDYVKDVDDSGADWNVWWFNCVDMAVRVGDEAGVTTISTWPPLTAPSELSNHLNGL